MTAKEEGRLDKVRVGDIIIWISRCGVKRQVRKQHHPHCASCSHTYFTEPCFCFVLVVVVVVIIVLDSLEYRWPLWGAFRVPAVRKDHLRRWRHRHHKHSQLLQDTVRYKQQQPKTLSYRRVYLFLISLTSYNLLMSFVNDLKDMC